jgi:hypothetical protein
MTTRILRRKPIGHRYELTVFWTRFGTVEYVVCDRDEVDPTGLPAMIRQESSYAQAVAGLMN